MAEKFYIKLSDSLAKKLDEGILVTQAVMKDGERFTTTYQVVFERKEYTDDFNCFTIPKDVPNNVSYWADSNPDSQPKNPSNNNWLTEGRKRMKLIDFMNKYLNIICIKLKLTVFRDGAVTPIPIDDEGSVVTDMANVTKIINRACEILIDKNKANVLTINPKVLKAGGNNIKNVYGTEEAGGTGNLTDSCMRPDSGHGVRRSANFYDFCPCSIVYDVDSNNRLLYRAILWDLDDGTKYLDRQYARSEITVALQDWAKEQGFKTRTVNSKNDLDMRVTISEEAINYLTTVGEPYFDSFNYIKDNVLYNRNPDNGYDYSFNHTTDGTPINIPKRCSICNKRRHNFVSTPKGNICTDCADESYDKCDRCGKYEEKGSLADCNGNEYCEYCAERKGYTKCAICEKWTTEQHYIEEKDMWVCDDCITDEYFRCDECGDWVILEKENLVKDESGEPTATVCTECFNKVKTE